MISQVVVRSLLFGIATVIMAGVIASASEVNVVKATIDREYLGQGSRIEGCLVAYSHENSQSAERGDPKPQEFPAILIECDCPFPSQNPIVQIQVVQESEFEVVVTDDGGNEMERIRFQSIQPGLYRFFFRQPLDSLGECNVRLEYEGGVVAGEKRSIVEFLNRGSKR